MSLDSLRAGLAPQPRRPRRWLLWASATGVVVVLAVAVALWARRTTPRVVSAAQTAERPMTTEASTTSTTAAPVRMWPTTTLPPLVVHQGDAAYTVGSEGDVTTTGRWRCAAPTLVLLHADDIFVFTSWASTDADVVAVPVGHVDGARGVRADDSDGDGCDELVVDRADGAPVRLRP